MEKTKKTRSLEVRFSLLSVVVLFLCWIVVALGAFYLGFIMGRNDRNETARQRVPILEHTGEGGDSTVYSFPEILDGSNQVPEEALPPFKELQPAEGAPATQPVTPAPAATPAAPPPASAATPAPTPVPRVSPAPAAGLPPKQEPKTAGESRVVQIGAFQLQDGAQQAVANLKKKGYRCYFEVSTDPKTRRPYYRVLVGPFPSQEAAEAAKRKLETKEGFRGTMVRPPSPQR